jgi:hypothetical protein
VTIAIENHQKYYYAISKPTIDNFFDGDPRFYSPQINTLNAFTYWIYVYWYIYIKEQKTPQVVEGKQVTAIHRPDDEYNHIMAQIQTCNNRVALLIGEAEENNPLPFDRVITRNDAFQTCLREANYSVLTSINKGYGYVSLLISLVLDYLSEKNDPLLVCYFYMHGVVINTNHYVQFRDGGIYTMNRILEEAIMRPKNQQKLVGDLLKFLFIESCSGIKDKEKYVDLMNDARTPMPTNTILVYPSQLGFLAHPGHNNEGELPTFLQRAIVEECFSLVHKNRPWFISLSAATSKGQYYYIKDRNENPEAWRIAAQKYDMQEWKDPAFRINPQTFHLIIDITGDKFTYISLV